MQVHVNCVNYVYVLIIVSIWTVYLYGFYRCWVWPSSQAISKILLNISSILAVTVFGEGVVSGILDTGD